MVTHPRLDTILAQAERLPKVQRERVVKEVLAKKGVNEKAARLVLKDLDDVNEESVSHWLDDNADLFGIKVQQEEAPVSQQDIARLRQQDVLTQGAVTPDSELTLEYTTLQSEAKDEKTMLWEELKTRLERLRPEKMMEAKALQAENLNKLLKFRAFTSPYNVI